MPYASIVCAVPLVRFFYCYIPSLLYNNDSLTVLPCCIEREREGLGTIFIFYDGLNNAPSEGAIVAASLFLYDPSSALYYVNNEHSLFIVYWSVLYTIYYLLRRDRRRKKSISIRLEYLFFKVLNYIIWGTFFEYFNSCFLFLFFCLEKLCTGGSKYCLYPSHSPWP